jgi:Flp pilus assembly protein TadD
MHSSLPNPIQRAHELFLDFIDAATTNASDAPAHALLEKTRVALCDLNDDALMLIASRAQQPGLSNEAIRLTAAITRLQPERTAAWFASGLALQFANRHADAVQPYRRALEIERTFPNLRNNLATALMQVNSNADEVAVLLEESVAAHPDDANVWINLGRLRPTETDVARPLEASRRALALAPHSPLALNNYAMACKEAQQWDEAERAAHAACQYAPNDASTRVNLSMLQLLRGKYAEG